MPQLPSVNQQLWIHAARGRGASEMIRAKFRHMRGSDWIETVARFFDTTDDFNRIGGVRGHIGAYGVTSLIFDLLHGRLLTTETRGTPRSVAVLFP